MILAHTQPPCIEPVHVQPTKDAGRPLARTLVCVIDDDADVLTSLQFLLETDGFDVRTFRSGPALLGSQARQDADCLIIDYRMDGLDGLELSRRLRELGITAPILLITGDPDETIASKATTAGVHQVLVRPHLGDNLLAAVREATAAAS